jgi:hypothetical protein
MHPISLPSAHRHDRAFESNRVIAQIVQFCSASGESVMCRLPILPAEYLGLP